MPRSLILDGHEIFESGHKAPPTVQRKLVVQHLKSAAPPAREDVTDNKATPFTRPCWPDPRGVAAQPGHNTRRAQAKGGRSQ